METHRQLAAVALGAALEVVLFSRFEWDRKAPWVLVIFSCIFTGTFLLFFLSSTLNLIDAVTETISLGATMLCSLFTSIAIYRLTVHPLRSFPGPLAARISAYWIIKQNIPDLMFYRQLRRLHDQYGDLVRIRPRELSICHPDAVVDIHGPRNKIQKGEFYDQYYPLGNLQLTRDSNFHKKLRRYWDKAFQNRALQEYKPRIRKHYEVFLRILDHHAEQETEIDASHVLLDLFFDVVSDLTFGVSFDTLTTKKRNLFIGEFLKQQKAAGFLIANMPLFYTLRCIPFVNKKIQEWVAWYDESLEVRKNMTDISPDFYTYLSQADTWESNKQLEAQLCIIAGADTNAITISNVCYLLCQYADYQKILYSELSSVADHDGISNDEDLFNKPYLSGIINEALRLFPPVPSGVQRLTPPEGATIAGHYVPGHTVVTTPTWSLHRDARAFGLPNDFIPERWFSRPELVLRKDAFIPFGYGQYNCAGRPLAMMQLRMVIAMMVKRYEISFAQDKLDDCRRFMEDQADCFTLHLNPLPLSLRRR